jgi:hypothetical protein
MNGPICEKVGTSMHIHDAGCPHCLANDVLIARALVTGRLFLVCAACGVAWSTTTPDLAGHIQENHLMLASHGWTFAALDDVKNARLSYRINSASPDEYAGLIAWYPGFILSTN